MSTNSGKTTSCWFDTYHDLPGSTEFPPLQSDASADVCVIGAGIAGLSTAYLLARANKNVIVIDDGPIGGGESGRTTAHLASAMVHRYAILERQHGPHGAELVAESHQAALRLIEAIVHDEQIECSFMRVDGYLFAPHGSGNAALEQELHAAQRAGLLEAALLPHVPLDFCKTGPCLRFPYQAQLHPLKYLAALARCIRAAGGRIHIGSHAAQIEGNPGRVFTDAGHVISAAAIVVATNAPVNDRLFIHSKQAPYRTYVVGIRLPRGSVPRALYWDTEDPHHYVRIADAIYDETELLAIGGEDHRTGETEEAPQRFARLEAWARTHFPMLLETRFRWSGQVLKPADCLPFIGRSPVEHGDVFVATGDSHNHMTDGTIAGMLISDLILGRPNRWESLYDPHRITPRAIAGYARENLHYAQHYLDWLGPGDAVPEEDIARTSGAIVGKGLRKRAVYRDSGGILHHLHAECPHLGCMVRWNDIEKSWDCPCHGSRFDPFGRVINGPANCNLKPADKG